MNSKIETTESGQYVKGIAPKVNAGEQALISVALRIIQNVDDFKSRPYESRVSLASKWRVMAKMLADLGRKDLAQTLCFAASEVELKVGKGPFKSAT